MSASACFCQTPSALAAEWNFLAVGLFTAAGKCLNPPNLDQHQPILGSLLAHGPGTFIQAALETSFLVEVTSLTELLDRMCPGNKSARFVSAGLSVGLHPPLPRVNTITISAPLHARYAGCWGVVVVGMCAQAAMSNHKHHERLLCWSL